jgi:hypothetical protein
LGAVFRWLTIRIIREWMFGSTQRIAKISLIGEAICDSRGSLREPLRAGHPL